MNIRQKKYTSIFLILILIIFIFIYKYQKNREYLKASEPIIINLLTSVHPKLPWKFNAIKKKLFIKPGEVTNINYIVENLENINTSGIATFAYFPKEFGSYISKLNCFCYDAQILKPMQKDEYSLVLLIDPEVTKDSKTKNIKEVTIQFTFFDYKDFKKNES